MSGHPEIPTSRLTRFSIGGVDFTECVTSVEISEPLDEIDGRLSVVTWRAVAGAEGDGNP